MEKTIFIPTILLVILISIFFGPFGIMDLEEELKEKDALLAENELLITDLVNHTQELLQSNLELTELADVQHEVITMSYDVVTILQEEIIQKDLRIDELEREKIEMMKLLGYGEDNIITEEEIEIMNRIVESEATDCTFEEKRNVAVAVLNRVKSDSFPNDIESVVFQKINGNYSFSPLSDGRYYSVDVTEQSKSAVRDALEGVGSHDATYFMARSLADKNNATWFDRNLVWLFKDGSSHEYFREG